MYLIDEYFFHLIYVSVKRRTTATTMDRRTIQNSGRQGKFFSNLTVLRFMRREFCRYIYI